MSTNFHSDKPRILEFTRDFGDLGGGVLLGWAIATSNIHYGVGGLIVIGLSIYLRFYCKTTKDE